MLDVAIQTLLKILAIMGIFVLIVILLAIIFAVLSGIKEIQEQNKIRSSELKDFQKQFYSMLKGLDKDKKDL